MNCGIGEIVGRTMNDVDVAGFNFFRLVILNENITLHRFPLGPVSL